MRKLLPCLLLVIVSLSPAPTALAQTEMDLVKHYLKWHTLSSFASRLPAAFEDENFGEATRRPRHRRAHLGEGGGDRRSLGIGLR